MSAWSKLASLVARSYEEPGLLSPLKLGLLLSHTELVHVETSQSMPEHYASTGYQETFQRLLVYPNPFRLLSRRFSWWYDYWYFSIAPTLPQA
jgi:hypothetical protein